MKMKLLCLGIIAATVSINAAALEINKGHLVSHKEWSTSNAKGNFLARNLNLPKPKSLSGKADEYSYVFTYSDIGVATGSVGVPVNLTSNNAIHFYNTNQQSKNFSYTYSICASSSARTTECSYYYDLIQLDANGSFNDEHQSQLSLTYNTPGNYTMWSTTMIIDNQGDLQSISTSNGMLTIS